MRILVEEFFYLLDRQTIGVNLMVNPTAIIVLFLNLITLVLVFKGFQNSKINFTFKKAILGLLITILVINLVMTFII